MERYRSYGRNYEVVIDGKEPFSGSADPHFRGDPALPNPEDMLTAALAACHMVSYLALCAREGIRVETYEDPATACMELTADGGGAFVEASLFPRVEIAGGADLERAIQLHEKAHEQCYVASSVRFPVHVHPTVTMAGRR